MGPMGPDPIRPCIYRIYFPGLKSKVYAGLTDFENYCTFKIYPTFNHSTHFTLINLDVFTVGFETDFIIYEWKNCQISKELEEWVKSKSEAWNAANDQEKDGKVKQDLLDLLREFG